MSIYWAGRNQNYNEGRSTHIRISPHRTRYRIQIGNLKDIVKIRIDPASHITAVTISEVSFYQFGVKDYRLQTPDELARIRPFRNIRESHLARDGLSIVSDGRDPQMELLPEFEGGGPVFVSSFWRTIVFLGLGIILIGYFKRISPRYEFVPYAMLFAFSVVLIMASNSRINAHPDEYVHLLAAKYYTDHNLPPKVCDKNTLSTYSPYGVSRLNTDEIAYILAGKFANTIAFLPITDAYKIRFYNVLLFAILLIMVLRYPSFRIVCIPLLISPQVWYMFSYFNSEGTAIFAAMLAVFQVVTPGSMLRRIVENGSRQRFIRHSAVLAVLLATLLLVKKNFFGFDFFMGFWVLAHLVITKHPPLMTLARRVAPIILISAVIAGAWIYQHEAVNDFQLSENIAACREKMANPHFRADASLETAQPSMYWKQRGYPFTRIFEKNWGRKVIQSTFGDFGYLEIHTQARYYELVTIILILFTAYLLITIFRRGTLSEKLTTLGGIAVFALLMVVTMWNAWSKDFQPQGRYFFPMIPISGFILAWCSKRLNPRVVSGFTLTLFLFAVFFFIFIGLLDIRKF
ncbi:MAG: hypothetical protein DHS20C01_13040 [marine bacterium B5-7]|nr:MAG: hypothetical protein DHS20C01_13040 [marine bacterium B5-7]